MKGFKTKLLVAMIAALPITALAGPQGQGVNQRQHNQQARIHQGVKSGELTRPEARRLQAEQRHIRKEERAYRADGHLSPAERADLHRDLNKSSRRIVAQKHDGDVRKPAATRDPGVNQRQRNERNRIAQGVRSGELTRDEAKGLRSEQRDIRRLEREYKSDGKLTRDERKDLHQDLNAASKNIYNEKHDDERR